MPATGPIILIEDDPNDVHLICTAIRDLGLQNEIKAFSGSQSALDYLMLTTDKPLVILCDIRMPGYDGLSLLRHIKNTEYLRRKTIPMIFLTGIIDPQIVDEAYDLGIEGFFKKGANYSELKDQLLTIMIYWRNSLHPNSLKP